MSTTKVLLLCSSRLVIPSMQALIFFQRLGAVGVPEHHDEMVDNAKELLKDSKIPLLLLKKNSFEKKLIKAIERYELNTGLIITFSFKLPSSVYNLPTNGFYNIHPGSLPEYRGMDPVFQQIRMREKYAGITLHQLDDDFDSGPIIMTERIKLDIADTHGIVNEKLALVAAKLTDTLVKLIELDIKIPARKQDESKAVYYKKQLASDVCINWRIMTAENIIALINAGNPWNKGAITRINGKLIRILIARIIEYPLTEAQIPGSIVKISEDHLVVAALNAQFVEVKMVYLDEGFLLPGQLIKWGLAAGAQFGQV